MEKLLLHKCKWGPVACSPSLCSLSPLCPVFLSQTRVRLVLERLRFPLCWV